MLGQFNLRLEGPQRPFVCMGEAGMWLAWACLGVGPGLGVGPRLADWESGQCWDPTRDNDECNDGAFF